MAHGGLGRRRGSAGGRCAPASATSDSRTPTGPQLAFSGPTTFAANTPFHIGHGVSCAVGSQGDMGCALGRGMFSLYVDGV
ncbi:MAG: hypothetical protein J2P17_27170, partial [Mycobacterium sp.]|nr:hypothetical protein [Mycobacterium sp.]